LLQLALDLDNKLLAAAVDVVLCVEEGTALAVSSLNSMHSYLLSTK
jgi:hypothetical protein